MADAADTAPDYNAFALAAHQRKASDAGQGEALTHCEDCGERIPRPRQLAQPGCRLCVGCQEELEQGR